MKILVNKKILFGFSKTTSCEVISAQMILGNYARKKVTQNQSKIVQKFNCVPFFFAWPVAE